ASAVLLAAGSAFAIDPSTVPAGNRLFVSGATATNQALYSITILTEANGGLCAPGTIDVFVDTAGADQAIDANDQFLIACTASSQAQVPAPIQGQAVLIAKESNGGSNNGTRNVARSTPLLFLNPTAPSCDAPIAATVGAGEQAYQIHGNCSGNISVVPDAGVADVEAALFNTTTAADIAALNPQALFQIVFAPAVSENLYRAMQTSQGLTTDDAEANVPNITRAQLHRIFSGEAFTWDEFTNPDGSAFLAGEDVIVCGRGEDSGTQASFASFVLNERCNGTVPVFVAPDDPACLLGGCDWGTPFEDDFIFRGDGSGDVRACLNFHNGNGTYAIGVLSTNTTIGTAGRAIRFVGVDGAAPTLNQVANGGYQFVTENVLNIRGSGPAGGAGSLVTYITSNIGQPDVIAALNLTARNPGGDHGILGRPNGSNILENPTPVSEADMRANPVSSYTRGGNNCQPQSATLGSQILGGGQ
ncbi:MAG: substrate-binding domain-containing protein, partial [Pseudomonadota bacterium]